MQSTTSHQLTVDLMVRNSLLRFLLKTPRSRGPTASPPPSLSCFFSPLPTLSSNALRSRRARVSLALTPCTIKYLPRVREIRQVPRWRSCIYYSRKRHQLSLLYGMLGPIPDSFGAVWLRQTVQQINKLHSDDLKPATTKGRHDRDTICGVTVPRAWWHATWKTPMPRHPTSTLQMLAQLSCTTRYPQATCMWCHQLWRCYR